MSDVIVTLAADMCLANLVRATQDVSVSHVADLDASCSVVVATPDQGAVVVRRLTGSKCSVFPIHLFDDGVWILGDTRKRGQSGVMCDGADTSPLSTVWARARRMSVAASREG